MDASIHCGPWDPGIIIFMKKFFKAYKNKYMISPTVNQVFIRCILALLVSLLWYRFLDRGERGLGFIFQILGIVLVMLAWFNYLYLDNLRIRMPGSRSKLNSEEKKKKHKTRQMIDYTDEEVNPMEDLDPEEKSACRLASNVISGAVFLILGFVVY